MIEMFPNQLPAVSGARIFHSVVDQADIDNSLEAHLVLLVSTMPVTCSFLSTFAFCSSSEKLLLCGVTDISLVEPIFHITDIAQKPLPFAPSSTTVFGILTEYISLVV